ncbi:MAG: ABC transporter ATP-binding protein [Desulfobacterium sp.]|nr:ABC transporter ATP-binding protein [Desulfobacterium sp.]MBU3949929.1 ABC transporter ATP-binding protein [Pseudomonadota bacterium]MBU4037443.1 ABC transporter ATP-binding protein [Pseudomonadota bacterium]
MLPIISIKNFSKSFGKTKAVENLNLDIEKGELFGLIGPDGAGKTTTIRTIVTLMAPDSGEIYVNNLDVSKDIRKIRSITGYMPQRFSLYPDLSINQNLNFFANLFDVPKKEIAGRKKRLFQFSNLEPFANRLAGQLSGGMKQKLALSCTLIHNPVVLILDEPTTGVDPVSRNEFWIILKELKSEGVTILVSTPYMDEALKCDRIAIMHEGSVLAHGKPEALTALIDNNIYKLTGSGLINKYIDSIVQITGILSVQSFGDSLHLTFPKLTSEQEINDKIKDILKQNFMLKQIEPTIEDVFIALVEGKSQNGN